MRVFYRVFALLERGFYAHEKILFKAGGIVLGCEKFSSIQFKNTTAIPFF